MFLIVTGLSAQEKPALWDLTNCMDYALKNNIQIQKSKITLEQSGVTTKQAKAQLFPNLSASVNQNFSNYPAQTDWSVQCPVFSKDNPIFYTSILSTDIVCS